jgi:hypothetical protein
MSPPCYLDEPVPPITKSSSGPSKAGNSTIGVSRKRVSQACDKCDGRRPNCSACIKRHQTCSYNPSVQKRGLPEGYVRDLEGYRQRLDGYIGDLEVACSALLQNRLNPRRDTVLLDPNDDTLWKDELL